MNKKRAYGDYQTPLDFAEKVCCFLRQERNINPDVALEPTCGIGGFLKSSLIFNAKRYIGIEINPEYCQICRESLRDERVQIINADIFDINLREFKENNLLVIGNPPWVNNSELGALGSSNLPQKSNFKEIRGIDALTGAGNFDICENIILRLIDAFQNTNSTIAMLCKTSVARNIFHELKRKRINFERCEIIEFNASKIFDVNVSACLLLIQLTSEIISPDVCYVSSFEEPHAIRTSLCYASGRLRSSNGTDDDFDGKCPLKWRQGVKHDCAKVMELRYNDGILKNGFGEEVSIEPNLVYPLIKSSMFKSPIIADSPKRVIVTQKKAGQDVGSLKDDFPKTWEYLNRYKELFDKRKSSIYKKSSPFSMFGVGDYTFANYKVGISGFYKKPLFVVLSQQNNKPFVLDDTSYFVSAPSYDAAYVTMLYLNSDRVQDFLKSIAFQDSKRPYSKKVLERIDIFKIHRTITFQELLETEKNLGLESHLTPKMISEYDKTFGFVQKSLWDE